MTRLFAWLFTVGACVVSLAGAVLARPLGRWTAPRELVVMGDPFVFDEARTITFEGWMITRDATGDILVQRGMSEPESVMLVHPVLVQSDEAGTFLRTHSTGRPTRDDVDLWRAIERDATEVCAAVLGAALLVATWALVSVGVF